MSLARCALFALLVAGASNVGAQQDTVVKELPRPALLELLRHAARRGPDSGRQRALALVTRNFADRAATAEVARSAGFAAYDSYDDILRCANDTPPGCEFAVGDRVAAVHDVRIKGDTIVLGLTVSTFLRRRNGVGR